MIVCSCRRISDNDYDTKEELIARLKEDDYRCGDCLKQLERNAQLRAPDRSQD